MEDSWNGGTLKSTMFIGCSSINQQTIGTPMTTAYGKEVEKLISLWFGEGGLNQQVGTQPKM